MKDALSKLLFDEGRELVNIKFLPGDDPELTPARLRDAAADALHRAMTSAAVPPPHSGRTKSTLAAAF